MMHLSCKCKFRVFQPTEEYRQACPYVLIITNGDHHHPIPLPMKTPLRIREIVLQLLRSIQEDLPDITPRRFLRHPTVKSYLHNQFPHKVCPTLSDLHSSLANRSHLKTYILQTKQKRFPFGTGWQGNLFVL
jgi:hypothetical protein